MKNQNTQKLLLECDAGVKMAISSINEVMKKDGDLKLHSILRASIEQHQKLEKELAALLAEYNIPENEPSPLAKGMSWMKTNMKLSMDNSNGIVADLITDGCNMGIKSLYKYLNQYKDADESSRKITEKLISIEEKLKKELQEYL